MEKQLRSGVFHLGDTRARIPGPPGLHYAEVLQRGTLRVLLSMPSPPNRQTPHAQDEVYVIVHGRGVLCHDGKRDSFDAGDLLFVAAGVEHWFEDFSGDLAVWVVFYGPEGGEVPAAVGVSVFEGRSFPR
ncbi:MAG TPA: cupin domain-containing protein [Thermoanaerobaculia bacterium]